MDVKIIEESVKRQRIKTNSLKMYQKNAARWYEYILFPLVHCLASFLPLTAVIGCNNLVHKILAKNPKHRLAVDHGVLLCKRKKQGA